MKSTTKKSKGTCGIAEAGDSISQYACKDYLYRANSPVSRPRAANYESDTKKTAQEHALLKRLKDSPSYVLWLTGTFFKYTALIILYPLYLSLYLTPRFLFRFLKKAYDHVGFIKNHHIKPRATKTGQSIKSIFPSRQTLRSLFQFPRIRDSLKSVKVRLERLMTSIKKFAIQTKTPFIKLFRFARKSFAKFQLMTANVRKKIIAASEKMKINKNRSSYLAAKGRSYLKFINEWIEKARFSGMRFKKAQEDSIVQSIREAGWKERAKEVRKQGLVLQAWVSSQMQRKKAFITRVYTTPLRILKRLFFQTFSPIPRVYTSIRVWMATKSVAAKNRIDSFSMNLQERIAVRLKTKQQSILRAIVSFCAKIGNALLVISKPFKALMAMQKVRKSLKIQKYEEKREEKNDVRNSWQKTKSFFVRAPTFVSVQASALWEGKRHIFLKIAGGCRAALTWIRVLSIYSKLQFREAIIDMTKKEESV